ncbi:Hypothetical predicted protein [Paramuricea clavata]|uniref:MADF domain-containing protein n=1 Tax=Paramuricea clavata TaxID=317549 RepID=A0A7D9EAY8_PARCT|nr:Hypothetical predicted protein [Paramuricea clavata]
MSFYYSIFLIGEVLKRRWKNLRDGMMRCLKKTNVGQKSDAGASKMPTCKLFDQLFFLRDCVSNRETTSNITLPSASPVNDSICEDSPNHNIPPSTEASTPKEKISTPDEKAAKRKLDLQDSGTKNKPYGRISKRADKQDKMTYSFIVEILDKLPPKKNGMARVEIQQVLMKHEFDIDD